MAATRTASTVPDRSAPPQLRPPPPPPCISATAVFPRHQRRRVRTPRKEPAPAASGDLGHIARARPYRLSISATAATPR